ncbi:MAG: NnrS family protein, partial [Proteobacteria bacterium]|nr:NnrS family protein [Pseudomonadota bacterium]
RLGLATLCILIALIGGRIVPAFTRNWLAAHGATAPVPAAFGRLDRIVLIATAAALAAWTIDPTTGVAGVLLIAAGLLNAIRSLRWRAWPARREPLLFVLHVGYAWLWTGLILLGASHFVPALPQSAALHALTMGAIGTMTVAVMVRASLGHTGRKLTAGPGGTLVFGLVSLAGLLRIAAAQMPDRYAVLLDLSGVAWSLAFGLFVILFARVLCGGKGDAACAAP